MEYDLECESVSKRFGSVLAVDSVSCGIPSGSFFSILGPSGCGKTTLMRMIAGFEEPDSGDTRIEGQSVVATPPNRRNVKMVFQHLALFPMMNVGENIAYGLRCRGADKAEIARRIDDVLERINLPGVAHREIHQLSGGQKQRIAIARCMVLEPALLLLDEPLGALDLKLRESMKIELKQLQHRFGTTFVYITHDQSEALVMSDHVAVMRNGKFEQVGSPQELYRHPQTAFVAEFVGDSNQWHGRVAGRDGSEVKVEADDGPPVIGVEGGGQNLAEGAAVRVFVRPEHIRMQPLGAAAEPAPEPGRNGEQGKIDSLLFNGGNSRVLVRTASDRLIEVDLPDADSAAELREGEDVALSWPRARTMCFSSSE